LLAACAALTVLCSGAHAAPLADHKLGSGDLLVIQVFGETDLSGKFMVGPTGNITLPVVGGLQVSGLTLTQARDAVEKACKDLVKRPFVTVSLDEMGSERKVYASGYVMKPGPLVLPFGSSIADALAAAGPTEIGDLRRVRLTHSGGQPMIFDMSGFRAGTAMNINEGVQWGDVLYVPKLEDEITVLGQVQKPGSATLPIDQEIRIVDALGRIAGGLTASANRTQAVLLRKDEKPIVIDLRKLLLKGDLEQNIVMKAGDTLVVQDAEKISVLGEVASPRTFEAPEPLSVLEVLANAGGLKPESGPENAKIIRAGGTEEKVDLRALLREGKVANNVTLAAGDTLVVPEADPETVLFVGAVQKGGTFSIRDAQQKDILRLLTVVGTTADADIARVSILRHDQRVPVNLYKMLHDGDLRGNCDLEIGDVVLVPTLDRMYVLGAVGRQGAFPVEPDMKIIDALTSAGGLASNASANDSVLVRTNADGTSEFIKVKLADLRRGVAPEPTKLKAGDILYVPEEGSHFFSWNTLYNAVIYLGGVLGVVNAFR
jgi:protein involved in polysaccharide export with SLBB domain